ncbi:MAG: hypothetical protein ACFB21_12575 [Opitutales bacterium]
MLEALHLSSTAGFCALLWITQVLVYPQFRRVPTPQFAPYHAAHLRLMLPLVAPFFLGETLCMARAVLFGWEAAPLRQSASLALYAIVYGSTFAYFAPLHQRLASEPSPERIERLIRANWLRTLAESARLAVVFSLNVQG